MDEAHPLAIRGAWKKPFTGEADVVLAIGFKFWSGEKFGEPPTWSDKATYIQVDASAQRVGWHVPATVGIVGDPKLVLRQMIDKIKEMKLDFSAKRQSPWLRQVAEVRENYEQLISERAKKNRDAVPIHPDRLTKDLISVVDKDATFIIDSFTLSGYTSQWVTTHFPGQVVDAGPLASAHQWLSFYEQFWTARLDVLERLLRDEDARKATALKKSPTAKKGDDK